MNPSFIIKDTHPSLKGHFPGNPVVPGVVILDEVINIVIQEKPGFTIDTIPTVKFVQPLLANQQVNVELIEKNENSISFNCLYNDTRIVSGQLDLKSQ